jgi:hypothetical protein
MNRVSDQCSGSGLLSAALVLKKKTFFQQANEGFLESVSAVPRTMDAPVSLFAGFLESYHIGKGALLLPGPESLLFVQVASKGYDLTTLRRLRIPVADPLIKEKNLYIGKDISLFRSFFSIREFSVIEKLLVLPGSIEDSPAACIIVTEGDNFLFTDPPRFPAELLHSIAEGSHTFQLPVMRDERLFTVEEADELLSHLLEDFSQVSAGLIDCTDMLSFLKKKHPNGDPFALLHRGISFIAGHLKNSYSDSEVVELYEGYILVLIPSVLLSRAGALFHQASLTLRSRFGKTGEVPPVSFLTAAVPENGMSVSELFPDFSLPA